MDNCVLEITIEFLSVAFHSILYYANIYPKNIFEKRRKYSVVVHRSVHPEVNQYIDLCLKTIRECLKCEQPPRVEFAVTDNHYKTLMKFVFDLTKTQHYDDTVDAYLVQAEQNLRAFCLNLSTLTAKFKDLPGDCSFSIYIHTNESTAVGIASDPDLENFPLIEVERSIEGHNIIPLRSVNIRNYALDTYIEL